MSSKLWIVGKRCMDGGLASYCHTFLYYTVFFATFIKCKVLYRAMLEKQCRAPQNPVLMIRGLVSPLSQLASRQYP